MKKANELNFEKTIAKSAFDNFQGKLLQGHNLFMISVFDFQENYFSDTPPFDETALDWWTKEVTQGVNNNPEKAAGWTMFQWDNDAKSWCTYRPDGKHALKYDTSRINEARIQQFYQKNISVLETLEDDDITMNFD